MATYHVQFNREEGNILAGTQTKTGKWQNSSVVTEEAMAAVRDHLLYLSAKEKQDIQYAWNYNNGKTLVLKLEQIDTEKIEKK